MPTRIRRPRLLEQLRLALRVRHYSPRTEEAYVAWVRRYVRFHGMRHPGDLGRDEINQFLTALADRAGLSASSQTQALSAVIFLYREVLNADPGCIGDVVRARQPGRLPVVLGREEVRALLERLTGTPRIVCILLYGSGLRLLEALQLRVKDVDFAGGEIRVRRAKGAKDRLTVLPGGLTVELERHLEGPPAAPAGPRQRGWEGRAAVRLRAEVPWCREGVELAVCVSRGPALPAPIGRLPAASRPCGPLGAIITATCAVR